MFRLRLKSAAQHGGRHDGIQNNSAVSLNQNPQNMEIIQRTDSRKAAGLPGRQINRDVDNNWRFSCLCGNSEAAER